MNIDIQILFDGKPPQEFTKAVEQIKKAVYKPNPKLRQILLKPISDFVSGDATIRPGFEWLQPFKGFLGDRSKQGKYKFTNADSAPDIFAKIDDLRPILGDKVVNELVEAQRERGAGGILEDGLVTLELKQAITADKSSESITQQSPGKEVVKSLRQRVDEASKKAGSKQNKRVLQDWFLKQSDPKYRQQVGQVFNQKITNLLFLTRVDGKATTVLVPGAAKKLQIFTPSGSIIKGKGEANFRQFIDPQFTSSKSNSIVYKLNGRGMKFLESQAAEVTTQLTKAIADNFPTQLITYFTKGPGKGSVSKFVQGNQNDFTQVFAELLLVASEFDPSVGGKEFVYSFARDKRPMGPISTALNTSKIREPKKQKSEKQELISELQLTTLVQRAIKQRMPQGQPGGPPDPTPGILTNRTGRFVQSTLITAVNKRRSEMYFKYDPIYAIHEDKYKVSLLISNSIREVAQRVFGKKYYPIREKRL